MALTKLDKNLLGFSDDTDFVKLPSGTTAQRPSSAAAGQFRFNTTLADIEVYNGTAWVRMGTTPPTFSSVDYPGNDTALDPAGGQSLVINGTVFNANVTVTIGGTTPSSITRNSATQITVNTPAKTAGTYTIVIENTDGGTATASNAVSYNGIPAFTTAAGSLGSVSEGASMSFSVAAAEPDGGAITYAVTAGSLPSGASLNTSTGAITGTAGDVSANTTSNFTITATDNENQSVDRAFSITVNNINPEDNFNIVTYTGNGSTQSITGVGFKPDFVWIKRRNGDGNNYLNDSTRGTNSQLSSDISAGETTYSSNITSYDTDGFTLGTSTDNNGNGQTFVAWCWKANGGTTSTNNDGSLTTTVQANPTIGISIVTYDMTLTSSTAFTLGHGLGIAPKLIFFFALEQSGSTSNMVYPNNPAKELTLDNAGSFSSATSGYWNGTAPSSTVINMGGPWGQYHSYYGGDSVAYCFADVAGMQKIDSYTGNGSSTSGPIVETGFEPAFLMVKRTDSNDSWIILDNKRDTANPRNNSLKWDENGAEEVDSSNRAVDFLTNGFQLKTSHQGMNANNGTYLYLAIAANANTTTPTLADSFGIKAYSGNGSSQSLTGLGFQPNLIWIKQRGGTNPHGLWDSVRGAGKLLVSNTDAAETGNAGNLMGSFDADGFQVNRNYLTHTAYDNTNYGVGGAASYIAWAWKAGVLPTYNTTGSTNSVVDVNSNGGFSIVNYKGTGSNATVGHGLGAVPEWILIKDLDNARDWAVYHASNTGSSGNANEERLKLNSSTTTTTYAPYWNGTTPTSTVFSIGTEGNVNTSGQRYIAYCWTPKSGYSKFGSYTGTGATGNTVTVGFQPDFVMVKSTNQAEPWFILDSVRDTSNPRDNRLMADSSAAEDDGSVHTINFNSTSFTLNGTTGNGTNGNGHKYIYAAFKIN